MQIYLLFAERKSDALQLKILIYRPKGTVCKGFRRKDRRFSYLQGEICGDHQGIPAAVYGEI